MSLSDYEGRQVAQATIRVVNAGDGLSKSLAVDPVEYHLGDTVHLVLECEVSKVTYDEVDDETGILRRVHTLRAGAGTIVESSLVTGILDQMRYEIEQASGVQRLPIDDEPDEED